ncbi:histidine phosphatase family protein [Aneurinibacillus uraniidurans]|uniref:histidine phosphatase family protein n=1 Tax=Aneurinibacillus uraniidurans TaxID=2966586 RepID=UPI00234AB6DD|nr:histidine phosphatase family protein [Aneurinibacillus sp. B1]WCN36452.1 histidine phosphatase family protein [Aneurinibacillus sp. B1]
MKIGLVRHFKVTKGFPEKMWLTKQELVQWFKEYDEAEIEEGEVNLSDVEWTACFSSDMPRAAQTATKIYAGPIAVTSQLREIPLPDFKSNVKLPFLVWAILIRMSQLINPKTKKDIAEAKKRIRIVLDEAMQEGDGNVLIVSHAALMMYMRKELMKRGFIGESFKTPENGKLYVFEK